MASNPASPSIIAHVTTGLLTILRRTFDGIVPESDIVAAPLESISTVGGARQRVLLYLYRVAESAHLKNQGPDYDVLADGVTRVRKDPLTLDLHYLLVPFGGATAHLGTHQLLGIAALAFHDHAIFTLDELGVPTPGPPTPGPPPPDPAEEHDGQIEFHLTKEPLGIGDLAHIWEAVHEPYRLSVSYVVRTVKIRSDDASSTRRVEERRLIMESIG